jgi:hypothetical protein
VLCGGDKSGGIEKKFYRDFIRWLIRGLLRAFVRIRNEQAKEGKRHYPATVNVRDSILYGRSAAASLGRMRLSCR